MRDQQNLAGEGIRFLRLFSPLTIWRDKRISYGDVPDTVPALARFARGVSCPICDGLLQRDPD